MSLVTQYHGTRDGENVRIQLTDQAPLVRLTTREGEAFYLNVNEIVAVYPFVVIMAPACERTTVAGSKVSLRGSDGDTFWVCTETPEVVYNRASQAQRRV